MTDSRAIANALRMALKAKVLQPGFVGRRDDGATLAAVKTGIWAIIDVIDPPAGIEADTVEAKETGPENSREEVVGTSTSGTNKNAGGYSGFLGGEPETIQ